MLTVDLVNLACQAVEEFAQLRISRVAELASRVRLGGDTHRFRYCRAAATDPASGHSTTNAIHEGRFMTVSRT
jgi:hypothetical protein